MKKLLGILVLGLLWCNSTYALTVKNCDKHQALTKTLPGMFDACYYNINTNQGTLTEVIKFSKKKIKPI